MSLMYAPVAHDSVTWQPPVNWVEVSPGVIEPEDYVPSPWEVRPPPVHTPADAAREYQRCATNLPYFAFNYCWTLHVDDPEGPQIRRLPAYPYAREFLTTIEDPVNIVSEKARQMLATWMYMAAFLRDLLFRANFPMLVSSRRAKEVDDGGAKSTSDSLIGKVRFMYERLPIFLWQPLEFKLYSIRNLANNSFIRGETGAGSQASRGGNYARALMDEAAYQSNGEARFSGFKQACKRGLALNSTANGRGNVFARLVHSKTTTFLKVRMHWVRHPEKGADLGCHCGWQSKAASAARGHLPEQQFELHKPHCKHEEGPRPTNAWYERECADSTPEQVASELDIDYDRSTGATVFDGYDASKHFRDVAQLIDRRTRRPIGEIRRGESATQYRRRVLAGLIDPRKPLLITWDFGVSDETAVLLGQEGAGPRHTDWLDEIVERGKAWDYYHRLIVSLWYPAYLEACGWTPAAMEEWRAKRELDWSDRVALVPDLHDEVPRGCLPVYMAGDPTGKNRDSALSSWMRNLAMADPRMRLHSVPFGKKADPNDGSMLDWIDHVRKIARAGGITVTSLCPRLAAALGEWKWPTDKEGRVLPGRHLPEHNEHSHCGTSLIYLYRTKWRGALTEKSKAASDVQHELVVTASKEERRRAFPEGVAAEASRRTRHDDIGPALHGTIDNEDPDVDDDWDAGE